MSPPCHLCMISVITWKVFDILQVDQTQKFIDMKKRDGMRFILVNIHKLSFSID